MQTAGPSELGYANTALIIGLFDVLASKGILTRTDLDTIVTDAINKLEPTRSIRSMEGGIELIKSLFGEIRGSG
jgi:hypothetical protein